jgi:tRNA A37 methylthiotransferase MiaB
MVPGCDCTMSTRTRSVDEVIPLMASGQVLPYLDVPLQHSHPDVLKRMKRPASGEKNLERIQRLARNVPRDGDPQHVHCGFSG